VDTMVIGRPVDRLEEMELTVVELRTQIAELEAARVASDAERREVNEEARALRVALGIAEADVQRLEAMTGGQAVEQMRRMLAEADQRHSIQLNAIHSTMKSMQQQLREALNGGGGENCPRLPWIRGTGVRAHYRLYFVCPVALEVAETNSGDGYDIHLPKAALETLAPALRATIHALRSKLGSGRAVGLPLPNCGRRAPAAVQRIELAAVDALERSLPAPAGPRMLSQKVGAVPPAAYKLLRTTIETEDPGLALCGLERLRAGDGTVAWVRPGTAAERFRLEGRHALGRVDVVPLRLLA